MQLAWLQYTDDNQDVMPLNWVDNVGYDRPGSWVLGNAHLRALLTDLASGTLYPYVGKSAQTYLWPTDPAKTDEGQACPCEPELCDSDFPALSSGLVGPLARPVHAVR